MRFWYFWGTLFFQQTRLLYWVKSVLPFSELITEKSQVFSMSSYAYLHRNTQIRNRGGSPPLVLIGLKVYFNKNITVITCNPSNSSNGWQTNHITIIGFDLWFTSPCALHVPSVQQLVVHHCTDVLHQPFLPPFHWRNPHSTSGRCLAYIGSIWRSVRSSFHVGPKNLRFQSG